MRTLTSDRVTAAGESTLTTALAAAFDRERPPAAVEDELRAAVRLGRAALAGAGPGELVAHVAAVLYAGWYSRSTVPAPIAADPVHVEELRSAHAATAHFEDGWTVEQAGPRGQAVAARGPVRRVLDAIDYVDPGGRPPRAGAAIRPCARRDSLVAQPGWWVTWGAAWPAGGAPERLVRAYWNVSALGAPALVAELSRRLDRARVAWSLKCPSAPAGHARADAGVLLVEGPAWPEVAADVAAAHEVVREYLEPATPALALALAPGLAVAEDPGPHESFGGQRCRLVAEGIVAAGDADEAATLEAIAAHLRAAGVDPDRAHLAVRTARAAATSPVASSPNGSGPATVESASPPAAAPASADLLGAATSIGRRLVAEAVWQEGRCTWTGDDMEPGGQGWEIVHRSLGGTLYGGSAGVAWFLAALARRTGDPAMAETARGAAAHALGKADPATGRGLYDGSLGVALATLEVARAIGDDGLWEAGARLARDAAQAPLPAGTDLVAGDAGAALGFLVAARMLGDDELEEAAAGHGERLLAAALVTPAGACWPGPAGLPPLCGLAHGASGAVLALGELAGATGRDDFAAAADDAARWERSRYDRATAGWPDLRGPAPGAYPAYWCHGAGGIGLARLHRHARLRDERSLADAGAALEGVRATARAALEPGAAMDGSVCHGVAGLAEVLLAAHAVLGGDDHLAAARELGAAIAARAQQAGAWPCGIPGGGETPALMTGLAGIGLTLLRLHDPAAAPSPALPPGLAMAVY